MFLRRTARLAKAAAITLLSASGSASAQDLGCPAKNLLDTFKTQDAAAFSRIRAAADATPNGKHILWKIEHPDFEDKPASYLYGTLGISDPRLVQLSAKTEEAMSLSRRIAFEVEDLTADRTAEAVGVMANAMAPGSLATYQKALAKPEMARVSVLLGRTALPSAWLPRVKPWVVMLAASRSECEAQRLKQGKPTQDGALATEAENRGVGSFGLESAEHKLRAYAELSDDDQIALLKARIQAYDRIDERTEAFVQMYQKRDLAALWPLQMELDRAGGVSDATLQNLRTNFIDERNIHLRDRLAMHLSYGGVFVAINAIHLPGKTGIIDLLKDAGYTLTPVE